MTALISFRRLMTIMAAALLAACAVGPDYRAPDVPAVGIYTEKPQPERTGAAPVRGGEAQRFEVGGKISAEWWTLFGSPELDLLIRSALSGQPTLAAAQAALRQAEENVNAQYSVLYPSVDAGLSARRQRISGATFGNPSLPNTTFNLYNASVNVTYAIDVAGGARRELEALHAGVAFTRLQRVQVASGAAPQRSLGAAETKARCPAGRGHHAPDQRPDRRRRGAHVSAVDPVRKLRVRGHPHRKPFRSGDSAVEPRRESPPADLPRGSAPGAEARSRGGVRPGLRPIPPGSPHRVPGRRRRTARAGVRRNDAQGAGRGRGSCARKPRGHAAAAQVRRGELRPAFQRAAPVLAREVRARAGASGALRGHGRAVPGAGRRVVEPRARGFGEGGAGRLSRQRRIQGVAFMTKRMIIMLAIVGVLFGGLFGFKAFLGNVIKKSISSQGIPPQTISTAKAQFTEWQGEFQAVGTLRAVRGADLAPELPGLITAIHFQSGQEVAEGAPLVQLNNDSDVAKLQSLMAAVELAEANYDRDQKQLAIQAVSQAVVDADAATLKSAKAQVAEQRALVAKKLVRAPFAGRLGIRAVDVGQYVNAGTKLVTLQALDPVYVDFYAPQKSLGRIALKQKIVLKTDAFLGQQFPGEVSSIDPKVDLATRNVQVRATVRNPKRSLLPGMFATVVIASGGPQRFLTLPQTAVSYNPFGDTVFVVEESKGKDDKPALVAQQKFVTTGEARGDQVAILSGIKEGDTVVPAGQIKLRSGFPVIVNNSIQPANEQAPQPKDQ